ncbi:MAG: O-antigen ligase family protein, partial [Blastocatellia bacterium]
LLGVGLGAYETAYPVYARDNGMQGVVAEAHNDYLQILADGGIVGGLLAAWLIVVLARSVFRGLASRDSLQAGLAIGAGAGLLGMLVHSVFDFNLHLPSHALVFLVLSTIVSRVAELATESSPLRVTSPNLAPGFISEVTQ